MSRETVLNRPGEWMHYGPTTAGDWSGRYEIGEYAASVTRSNDGWYWTASREGRVFDHYGPYVRGDFARLAAVEAVERDRTA